MAYSLQKRMTFSFETSIQAFGGYSWKLWHKEKDTQTAKLWNMTSKRFSHSCVSMIREILHFQTHWTEGRKNIPEKWTPDKKIKYNQRTSQRGGLNAHTGMMSMCKLHLMDINHQAGGHLTIKADPDGHMSIALVREGDGNCVDPSIRSETPSLMLVEH